MPILTRESRLKGALLGLHAGDALGATLEFMSWEEIHEEHPTGLREITGGGTFNWPAGHATDDTDLTRAVLLAYRDKLRNPSQDVVMTAARHMLDWYEGRWPGRVEGETPVDVGGATALGLRKFRNTGDPKTSGAGEGKAGNGSLMRCLPTGLFQHNEDKLLAESMAISAITHDDFLCTISCAYYNSVVRYLLDGVPAEKAMHVSLDVIGNCVPYEKRNEKSRLAAQKVYRAAHWASLIHLDDLAARGPKNALNGPQILPLGASGFVLESLTIALAALLDPRPLEDVLVDIVKIGRDTDTNGAIAGGLLGAQRGLEAIPQRWRDKLQFGSEFTALVDEILALRRSPSP